jgi:hypothetical protein
VKQIVELKESLHALNEGYIKLTFLDCPDEQVEIALEDVCYYFKVLYNGVRLMGNYLFVVGLLSD